MKDKNFEPLKRFLKEYNLEITELHEANINVSENDGFYLYNYNQNVLVPRDDEIIRFCRGLVLKEDGAVMNFPFKRFFNAHETECDTVDWDSAEILEKLDGSLISVWWTGSEWEVTTRGSFYPNEGNLNFKEVFKRLFNKFSMLEKDNCYMFELISKDNRIVTKYDAERVVLIGARHINSGEEFYQEQLDYWGKLFEVERPRRYKASNVDECRKLFEQMKDDEEGLVIVDKNFNRMKLKQESYLKMSRIINMKNQDILDYVLGKTELDADFTGMEDIEAKIHNVKSIYEDVKDRANSEYGLIKNIESQKDFAEKAKLSKMSSIIFKLRQGKTMEDLNIRYDKLEEMYNSINDTIIPEIKKLVVLRGIPGSGKSTWIKDNGLEIYTLSMDTIRLMIETPSPYISQEYNAEVWNMFRKLLEKRMSNGSFTILDNVHAQNRSLKEYKDLCEQYGYELIEKRFDVTLEEALERNKKRETYKWVPEEAIEKMFNQLNANVYKP